MSTDSRTLEVELFGRAVRFDYSERWVGYSLFLPRVVMGWTLSQGGITKLVIYLDLGPSNNWTATGHLANAIPEGNPLMGLWSSIAGSPLTDMLNVRGLMLAGLALILGAFVRFNAFWGAVMMLFYWAAALEGGILAGPPLARDWVVNDHIVYAVLLFGLGVFGAGHILDVDAYLENMEFMRRNRWMSLVMG